MKSIVYFISIFFFLNSHQGFSQDNAARIQEIKTMYSEIVELQKNTDQKQCKTGKKTTYESLESSTTGFPFEQTAEKCTLKNNYSIIKGNFKGYEWGNDIFFYYKNNNLFFVYSEGGAESCYSEYRIYYDIKGNVIKILEKSNDCSGETPVKNTDITEPEEQKRILLRVNEDLAAATEMLK
jgi:hypothetical protein